MADTERRYGPTIDLQGFDLGTNMDTIDEPSRLPLLVVIALVVLAAFAGVVWLAYTQGVERGRESVSRELISQALWKVRKSSVPAYTGLKIYEPLSASDQNPNPKAAVPAKRIAENVIPALRPTAGATPDGAVPAPAMPSKSAALPAPPATAAVHPQNVTAPSAPVAAKIEPQRVATRAPTNLTKPTVAPVMPAHPITAPDSLPPPTSFKAPAASSPSPAPASTPTANPKSTPAPPATTGIVLQIGSYKSETEANESWKTFKAGHDAASGYQPDVRQVDLGAKGTWYRLRMGPFPDKKAALETCAKLKADGASCLLAQ
jgi:cell division protein FtsN